MEPHFSNRQTSGNFETNEDYVEEYIEEYVEDDAIEFRDDVEDNVFEDETGQATEKLVMFEDVVQPELMESREDIDDNVLDDETEIEPEGRAELPSNGDSPEIIDEYFEIEQDIQQRVDICLTTIDKRLADIREIISSSDSEQDEMSPSDIQRLWKLKESHTKTSTANSSKHIQNTSNHPASKRPTATTHSTPAIPPKTTPVPKIGTQPKPKPATKTPEPTSTKPATKTPEPTSMTAKRTRLKSKKRPIVVEEDDEKENEIDELIKKKLKTVDSNNIDYAKEICKQLDKLKDIPQMEVKTEIQKIILEKYKFPDNLKD